MINSVLSVEVQSNCPYDVSYHYPIIVCCDIDLLSSASGSTKLYSWTLQWSKADDFERKMCQTEIDKLFNFDVDSTNVTDNDAERFSNIFTSTLHVSVNAFIPVGKYRPHLKPYWKVNRLQDFHYE